MLLGDRVRIAFAILDRLAQDADRDVFLVGEIALEVFAVGGDVLADYRRRAAFARIAQRNMLILVFALLVELVVFRRRVPILVGALAVLGRLGAMIVATLRMTGLRHCRTPFSPQRASIKACSFAMP